MVESFPHKMFCASMSKRQQKKRMRSSQVEIYEANLGQLFRCIIHIAFDIFSFK